MKIAKKIIPLLIITLIIFLESAAQTGGWDPKTEKKSKEAIAKFKEKDPDMKFFFKKAFGYAVFPSIGKGGIGIGGAHGKGLVYQKGKIIGEAKMTQVTIGFQLGGQSYREIIFFENKKALDSFKNSEFEFAAQASAVAADKGASVDVAYEGGVAVFTMAKGGLMYEASIGGQKFKFITKGKK